MLTGTAWMSAFHLSIQSELSSSLAIPSIFPEAFWLRDSLSHQVVISSSTNMLLPSITTSCATPGSLGNAVFTLANQSTIYCILLSSLVSFDFFFLQLVHFESKLIELDLKLKITYLNFNFRYHHVHFATLPEMDSSALWLRSQIPI